jgi:spermidine/putrescine transport system permease protein
VTTVVDRPASPGPAAPPPGRSTPFVTVVARAVRQHAIAAVAVLVLAYLFLPVVVVVVFSFNDPAGRFNFAWQGFTLDAWLHPCSPSGMCDSVLLSLQIGLLATLVATVLGTLLAFGLVRHQFRGRAATSLLVFLPMATP